MTLRFREPLPALVLAAGLGTRLRPLTANLAKPAVPFLGRPLIHYPLDLLYAGGVRSITVNLHHHAETVRQAVESWRPPNLSLQFSWETEILGTGGAFLQAASYLQTAAEFVVINGKIYFEQDLGPIILDHKASNAWVTMVVVPHSGQETFNPVLLGPDRQVESFALRSQMRDLSNAYIYTGLQVVSQKVLKLLSPGFSDTVKDIYPRLIGDGRRIRAFVSDQFWCESSTPLRYLYNVLRVARRLGAPGRLQYDQKAEIVAGENFRVGKGVDLTRVVAWNQVTIGAGSQIRNAILLDGCNVPENVQLENVVIVPRTGYLAERAAGPDVLGDCLVFSLR